MNLKEAFRYQNKLQRLMDEAAGILENEQNVTKTEYTHLRHKVMAEAEDEITVAVPETEYAEQINEVIEFLVFLLSEREKLSQVSLICYFKYLSGCVECGRSPSSCNHFDTILLSW